MKIVLVAGFALALAACGSGGSDEQQQAAGAASAQRAAAAGDEAVAAVLQSTGAPVARLSFVIESRPEPGKPFRVRLVVTAAEAVPALQLGADSTSLAVSAASAPTVLALAQAGEPVTHALELTAAQEGLSELFVRLRRSAEEAETVYVIPVLVGKPAAAG